MNSNTDIIELISNFGNRMRCYALDIFKNGNIVEIERLINHYPELLYHQYTKNEYWHELSWDFVYESCVSNYQNPEELILSRLNLLNKLNYTPTGMFRERLIATFNPIIISHYIELFENDTAKKHTDANGKIYSSLLSLAKTFIGMHYNEDSNKNDIKKVILLLTFNASTEELNKKDRYGFISEGLLNCKVFTANPVIIFELISKGMRLDVLVESRNDLALEYASLTGQKDKIKPHSEFDESCIEIQLIQNLFFNLAKDFKFSPSNYKKNIGNQLRMLENIMPLILRQKICAEVEIERILNFLNIDVLSSVYYDKNNHD